MLSLLEESPREQTHVLACFSFHYINPKSVVHFKQNKSLYQTNAWYGSTRKFDQWGHDHIVAETGNTNFWQL